MNLRPPTAIALYKRMERRGMLLPVIVMSGPWEPPTPEWEERMTAFDQLPSELQHALRESDFDLNAVSVLKRFRERGLERTLAWVRESERRLRGPTLAGFSLSVSAIGHGWK